jgi:tRNA1(Val) A37 N6-methylase TrmN6
MPDRQRDDDRRFVPLDASLTSDAPGYGEGRYDDDGIKEGGPVCWKCHGGKRRSVVVDKRALGVQKKETKKKKAEEKQRRSAQQQPPNTARTMSIETLPVAAGARPPPAPIAGEPDAVAADPETTMTTTTTQKVNNNNAMVMAADCHICHGSGRLPVRIVPPRPGKVTRGRNRRNAATASAADDNSSAPRRRPLQPVGYQIPYYGALVETATRERVDIVLLDDEDKDDPHPYNKSDNDNEKVRTIIRRPSSLSSLPTWWPSQPNEELCNLVGEYRILQKVKDHRWTTDDLVTAAIAARSVLNLSQPPQLPRRKLRYCDLGTGNGSVLQMVLYKLLSHAYDDNGNEHRMIEIELAVGVEARQEALNLLRRSLAFNLGDIDDDIDEDDMDGDDDDDDADDDNGTTAMENHINDPSMPSPPQQRNRQQRRRQRPKVRLVHDDFRQFPSLASTTDPDFAPHSFDLVTGTPPYFAVQYNESGDDDDDYDSAKTATSTTTTTAATTTTGPTTIIQQGAMPAARQSAPARCEFRGGIDEYCAAAARLLKPHRDSRFICCVNHANHARALRAMQQYGLCVVTILYVRGKVGRDRLFVVYVARPMVTDDDSDDRTATTTTTTTMVEERELSVRDGTGAWTDEYQNDVLRYMDIID